MKSNIRAILVSSLIFLLCGATFSNQHINQTGNTEILFNNKLYTYDSSSGRFLLNGRAISSGLNNTLEVLQNYKKGAEKTASLNPVRIGNHVYNVYFFYTGDISDISFKDYTLGWHIFYSAPGKQPIITIKGIIALNEKHDIVRSPEDLRKIFLSALIEYRFTLKNLSVQGYTKYSLGDFDYIYSDKIGDNQVELINNLNDNLISKLIFVNQEVASFFTDMLKGGAEKQKYIELLNEMLCKTQSDFSPDTKKEVFQKIIAAKSIAKDFFGAGKYSQNRNISEVSKKMESMLRRISTVRTGGGRYGKIVRVAGREVNVFWSVPLIELVFALAEERVHLEDRVELLKTLSSLLHKNPRAHKPELIEAIDNVIKEAEFTNEEELANKFMQFLVDKGVELGIQYSRNLLINKWSDFIWKTHQVGARTLSQHLLAGAAAQISLGLGISNILWGMDAIYDSAVKARAAIEITDELKRELTGICLSQAKYKNNYYYEDAENIRALLAFLGLSRAVFFRQHVNIAGSSPFKTFIVDLWTQFWGQKTMSEAIEELKLGAKRTELATENNYILPDSIDKAIELVNSRIGRVLVPTFGTALALTIDSSGSMNDNDPNNSRTYAAELVIDQSLSNWEIGIVDFDDSSKLLAKGLSADPKVKDSLRLIDSSGMTDIGSGLLEAYNYLNTSPKEEKAAILLTDGLNTSGKFVFAKHVDIFAQKGWKVYTVGLTGEANEVLLSKIAYETGGQYFKANTSSDMIGFFDLILSHFKKEAVVYSEDGQIAKGEEILINYPLDSSISQTTTRTLYPGSKLGLSLTSPNGEVFTNQDISKGVEVVEGSVYKIIRVKNPTPGKWQAKITGIDVPAKGEPFKFRVTADTPIKILVSKLKASYAPYEPINFNVDVSGEIDKNSIVNTVEIETPEMQKVPLVLGYDRAYQYVSDKAGVYFLNVNTEGKNIKGEEFTREEVKHIVIATTGVEFGVGQVIQYLGGYIEINLGKEIGLRPGQKIFVFEVSDGKKQIIAEGYVTSVFPGKSTVELNILYGFDIPKAGSKAEIDRTELKESK